MKAFIPAIFWALLILFLSSGPGIPLPSSWWDLFSPDKVGHAVVYGIFTILLLRGFPVASRCMSKVLVSVALLSGAYGIAMEVMQYAFFPGRYFEVLDIIANIIGTIAGLIIYCKYFISKT